MQSGKKELIGTKDIIEAINLINPSTTEWLQTAENYVKYSNQSGLYDQVLDYLKKKDY